MSPPGRVQAAAPESCRLLFLPMKARQALLPTRSQATTDGVPESNGHLLWFFRSRHAEWS